MKIKCPACNFENKEGAKFCSNCNEPLVTPKISINKKNSYTKKETSNNTENTNIKKIIKKERLRMNKRQRVILAIFIPVLFFFIALTIAYYASVEVVVITPEHSETFPLPTKSNLDPEIVSNIRESEGPDWQPGDYIHIDYPAVTHKYYNPYDWQRTWYVWLLFLVFCCFFEYKLFEDKERIKI
jgi:uncharacterized Zn finger protein (UPF0148 family)